MVPRVFTSSVCWKSAALSHSSGPSEWPRIPALFTRPHKPADTDSRPIPTYNINTYSNMACADPYTESVEVDTDMSY